MQYAWHLQLYGDGYVITWEQREQSLSSASAVYNQQRGHWWWEAGRRASDRRLDPISVSALQLHDKGFAWSFEHFSRTTLETPRRLDSISAKRKSIVHLSRTLIILTVALQKFIQRGASLGLQEQLCLTWCLDMPRIKCQAVPAKAPYSERKTYFAERASSTSFITSGLIAKRVSISAFK